MSLTIYSSEPHLPGCLCLPCASQPVTAPCYPVSGALEALCRLAAALQVLTMEYVPGVKINAAAELDAMGVDRALLAQRSVECYLQQLLTYGFFHAGTAAGRPARTCHAHAAERCLCLCLGLCLCQWLCLCLFYSCHMSGCCSRLSHRAMVQTCSYK